MLQGEGEGDLVGAEVGLRDSAIRKVGEPEGEARLHPGRAAPSSTDAQSNRSIAVAPKSGGSRTFDGVIGRPSPPQTEASLRAEPPPHGPPGDAQKGSLVAQRFTAGGAQVQGQPRCGTTAPPRHRPIPQGPPPDSGLDSNHPAPQEARHFRTMRGDLAQAAGEGEEPGLA